MRVNHLDDHHGITDYVRTLLKAQGRDFTKCESCGNKIPEGKYILHHTKYEGAGINDIMIVCQSCNLKKENKGLK